MQCHVWHCGCYRCAMHGVMGAVITPCGCCSWHYLAVRNVMRAVILPCLVLPWSLSCRIWCQGCCCRTTWVLQLLSSCHIGCHRCCHHTTCDVGGAIITPHGCCSWHCYHLSKRPNCFPGICDGLMSWWPRCTTDAMSETWPIIMYPPFLLMTAPVTQSGSVNPTTPVLFMTHASAPAPVPFPQLSPLVRRYHPTLPSPYTLGQQVTAYHPILLSYTTSSPYCLVIASLYTIVLDFLLSCSLYCSGILIVITYTYYW